MHVHHMCSRHHHANIFVFNSLDRKEGGARAVGQWRAITSPPLFLAVLYVLFFMEQTFYTLRRRRLPLAGSGRNFILYVVTYTWLFPPLYGCSLRAQKLMLYFDVSPIFQSTHFSRIRARRAIIDRISPFGRQQQTTITNREAEIRTAATCYYFFLSFEREIEIWRKVENNITFFSSCRCHFPAVVTHGL